MKFNIFYDKSTYMITFLCFCLIFGLPILFFFADRDISFCMVFLAICCPILVVSAAFAPRCYVVEQDKIIIKKVIGKITFYKDDIETITTIEPKVVKEMYRKFAVGGFFGFYGLFYSRALKNVYMYAGTMKASNLLLIKLKNDKKYVISPKGIEDFLLCVKEKRG